MPNQQDTDAFGVEGGSPTSGPLEMSVYNADTVNLYQGAVVQLVNPGTAAALTHISVKLWVSSQGTTTVQPLILGVVSGSNMTPAQSGTDPIGTPYIPPGGVGQIVTLGHTKVLMDAGSAGTATPTSGHILTGGYANGCLTDSGATTGTVNRGFGVVWTTQNAFLTVSSQSAATTVLTLVLSAGLPTTTNNVFVTGTTGTTNAPNGAYVRSANAFALSNTSLTTVPSGQYFTYKTTVNNDTIALNLGSTIGTLGGTAILSFGILYDAFFRAT